MTPQIPIRELTDGRLTVVYLDPQRYTATERMYLAARVTRSFEHPDMLLAGARGHLDRWAKETGLRGFLDASLFPEEVPQFMERWLAKEIAGPRHDSVLEFAGLEYAFWIRGLSLGTIRDVDRHRRFSYEEYTTRALGASLKQRATRLTAIAEANRCHLAAHDPERWPEGFLDDEERAFLEDLFYVHPGAVADSTRAGVDAYLLDCALDLRAYMAHTQDSTKRHAADIWRGKLPLALRTPFMMGGNLRDWFEAAAKRTCARVGHVEYVTLFRLIVQLMQQECPLMVGCVSRWCPTGETTERCCRSRWAEATQRGQSPDLTIFTP